MRSAMSLAAASASRQPASTPLSSPNSAITPSPMNLSMRSVDGVADCGDRDCGAVTHFAHDCGAGMDADADPQRLGYVVNQRAIEGLHALGHVLGRRERLTAARLDAAVESQPRHHPIADELVDAPARGLDRM